MRTIYSRICRKRKSTSPSWWTNTARTAGIITIEDLLEEIVGNIYDEYDPVEAPDIEKLEDNLWRVTGSTYIEDLAEALDIELPGKRDYDTVGGMVFSCLNWIPEDGSQFDVQVNGLDPSTWRKSRIAELKKR